jgi:glyoxylase-like metal-dependent hydrolase (beta-lactamase superfamily II)
MKTIRLLAVMFTLTVVILQVAAQQRPTAAPSSTTQNGPFVRSNATRKIASHTYIIPDFNTGLVPNVGIIAGERGTLVIDTGLGPRNGETVLKEAHAVNGEKPINVAFTHFHPEHDLGASAFPATAKVIRSAGEDADIAEFGLDLANTFASRSPVNAELLRDVDYRKTDISFDGEYHLDLGGVHVGMYSVGPAHTRGDTVFFIEEDHVLFSGDVAMQAFPAFASPYSSVRAWLNALDRLSALKPTIVVPSHGPTGDASFITRYREYLRALQSRVRELKAEGKSAGEAAPVIQAEMEKRFPDMPQPSRVTQAVAAAYNEAQ